MTCEPATEGPPSFWRRVLHLLQGASVPSAFRPLRITDPVEHNERIIAADLGMWYRYNGRRANELVYHPTIMCRWSTWSGGSGNHGPRPAVWRRDMREPECAACLVEDPSE